MDLSNATIGQLLIPVDDVDRAVPFYRDVLGLQFLFSAPPQMAFFQCGGELWLAEFTDSDGNQLALMSQTTSDAA
jgi:predicted enzyme related to lactoylglutathione lyase